VLFLRAQFEGQFCSIFLSIIWRQELNVQLESLLVIPNWDVLLTLEGQEALQRDLDRLEARL